MTEIKEYYTEDEDFLNSYGTRNCENTEEEDFNCGGYALNTFSWYLPYPHDTEDEEEDIVCLIEDGYSKEEIYEMKLEQYTKYMLSDFPNLRVLTSPTEIKSNERLIYFRLFFEMEGLDEDGYYEGIHTDFHYRYFDNGEWLEKCGTSELRVCNEEEMEGIWKCGLNAYDSRTVYLALEV